MSDQPTDQPDAPVEPDPTPDPTPDPAPILEPVEVATISEPVLDVQVDHSGVQAGLTSGLQGAPCGRHYVAPIPALPDGVVSASPRRGSSYTHIQTCTLPYGHDGDHGQAS